MINKSDIENRIKELEVKRHAAFGIYSSKEMRDGFFKEKAKQEMIEAQCEITRLGWKLRYGR